MSPVTRTILNLPLMSDDDGWSLNAGPNELGAHLELLSRLSAALVLSAASNRLDFIYPRTGGAGTFRSFLELLSLSNDVAIPARSLCRLIVETWGKPHTTGYVDALEERNSISHGGLASRDPRSVHAWRSSLRTVTDELCRFIDVSGGLWREDGVAYLGSNPVWPLIVIAPSSILLFQSWKSREPCYFVLGSAGAPISLAEKSLATALRNMLGNSSPYRYQELHLLINATRSDVVGFAADESVPTFEALRDGQLELRWVQRTSAGDVERSDRFRVAADNQRQWQNPKGAWGSYSDFVRNIANWDVVVKRLKTRFDRIIKQNEIDSERIASPSGSPLVTPKGMKTRFRPQSLLEDEGVPGIDDTGDLEKALDEAANSVPGLPQIFFLTGEAGIGKTYNLLNITKARHERLTANLKSGPLFLYLSCGGKSLQSLEEIVNSEVVNTQNLNFESVLTLCRNGLLVPIIDGFDELIEGAGYSDAYKVLSPTIERLGDRGVLLVSARSSYLANQYRSSLMGREMSPGSSSARHTVLELMRWSTEEVCALFNVNPHWRRFREGLNEKDFALLGVPYFSRVFNSWAAGVEQEPDSIDLERILIDGYLAREIDKFEPSTRGSVSASDLYEVFREVAGLVFESSTASVDQTEFEDAASYAMGIDLSDVKNRSLAARMSVLCGISVTGDQTQIGFRFEHDVFYEMFVSAYIVKHFFDSRRYSRGVEFVGRGILGDKTVDDLVDVYPEHVGAILGEAMKRDLSNGYLRQNASALAERLLASGRSAVLPNIAHCELQEVRLGSDSVSTHVHLRSCTIGVVYVPVEGRLSLDSCRVKQLRIQSSDGCSSRIHIGPDTRIDELVLVPATDVSVAASYLTHQFEIWSKLAQLGLEGADLRTEQFRSELPSALEEFAEAALTRLWQHSMSSYVVHKSNRLPGDGAMKGMYDRSSPWWANLTSAAIESGLASCKPLNASGPAKLKIGFVEPIDRILDRQGSEEIRLFWERMEDVRR